MTVYVVIFLFINFEFPSYNGLDFN